MPMLMSSSPMVTEGKSLHLRRSTGRQIGAIGLDQVADKSVFLVNHDTSLS